MSIAPETKIVVADGDTGVVEWTGSWAAFADENDEDTVAEIQETLEKGEAAYVGGGAAAFFRVSVA